jgi:hypothetical protein
MTDVIIDRLTGLLGNLESHRPPTALPKPCLALPSNSFVAGVILSAVGSR